MKILFFPTFIFWSPHFETDLEIAESYAEEGHEVFFLYCNSLLPNCELNLSKDQTVCNSCINKRNQGFSKINSKIKFIDASIYYEEEKMDLFEELSENSELASLKELKYNNFDLGMGVVSSLIDFLREPEPEIKENFKVVQSLLKSSLMSYNIVLKASSSISIDRIYAFNGRFATQRALLRAAETLNISVHVHERGSSKEKYEIFPEKMPHEPDFLLERMQLYWQKSPLSETKKNQVAEDFFLTRKNGKDFFWTSFVSQQEDYKLPKSWDRTKRNIVIFNSSDDEYAAIGSAYEGNLYHNQEDGIQRILDSLKFLDAQNIKIYLRVHPGLKGIKNSQTNRIQSLSSDFLEIIQADDSVSTYNLMDSSEKVLTFRSTMGIEATYWNKPSILLGKAYYSGFDCVYKPKSHEEVIDLLLTENLPLKDKNSTKVFAFYYSVYGIPFRFYEPDSLFSGKFKGDLLTTKNDINSYNVPILIIAFNRPDFIEMLIRIIDSLNPERVYISIDGPRNQTDQDKIEKILFTIGSNLKKSRVFYKKNAQNLGCRKAVKSAIDWFFENEDQGIILEDDCIPNRSFFGFMRSNLEKYKNDPSIAMIGAANYQRNSKEIGYFYRSGIAEIWGWGTWKESWLLYKENLEEQDKDKLLNKIYLRFGKNKPSNLLYQDLLNTYNGNIDTWDYQWWASILLNDKSVIKPFNNFIKNIGGSSEGTHNMNESLINNLETIETIKLPSKETPSILSKYLDKLDMFLFYNIKPSIFLKFLIFLIQSFVIILSIFQRRKS